MERLRAGDVVEETYRVDSMLSEGSGALVYGVTHARFPDVPLALKIAAPNRALDFDRDTSALSSLTGPCFVRVVDRGTLADGRYYRVMERLAGPTLHEALASGPLGEDRATELVVALAAAVHEANAAGIGPCDLSVDNLMFADGKGGAVCLTRAIVPFATGPDADADQRALTRLQGLLAGGMTQLGAHEPGPMSWKPPSSAHEIKVALGNRAGRYTPAPSGPGAKIDRWEVARRLSDSLSATVYEVTGPNRQRGVLKVPGPQTDHAAFTKHADLLSRVQSRNVVRVVDFGTHDGTPFMVMDPLHMTQGLRVEQNAPLAIDAALQTVDELLWGAEAISKYGGSPADFSLEHCYQATREPSPAVLTRAMLKIPSFGLYGRPTSGDHADAWSAAVALYELIAARLPFPTSKHSLAKAWMGMPIQLASRRKDVPAEISELVHAILMGKKTSTADLRREITRIRSAPGLIRKSAPPERISVTPAAAEKGGSAPPPPARVLARTEHALTPPERMTPPPPGKSAPPPARPGAPGSTPETSLEALAAAAGPLIPLPIFLADPQPPAGHETMRRSIEPPPRRSADVTIAAPAEWRLRLADAKCPLDTLSAAAIDARGEEMVAVGQDAVARFKNGRWTLDPARLAPIAVLSLVPMGDGWLATTSSGPLLRLGPTGGFSPWGVALERYVFHAALPNGEGFTLVGGTRDRSRAVVAKLAGESLTIVTDGLEVRPLRAATFLADGALLGATEDGTIVVVRKGAIAEGIRPANVTFLAAAVAGPDIVVVGAGAWAFRVGTNPLTAALEPVDTLSALTCVAVEGDNAWAGSDKGRVLRRQDGHWKRMNASYRGDPGVLAIQAGPDRMSALLSNGSLIVGERG